MKKPTDEKEAAPEKASAEGESRDAIHPLTGLPYVKAPAGESRVTSDHVYELLRDFP